MYSRDMGRGNSRESLCSGPAGAWVPRSTPARCRCAAGRPSAGARRRRRLVIVRGRDDACPISTGGGTRRVQLVREGGGGRGAAGADAGGVRAAARVRWCGVNESSGRRRFETPFRRLAALSGAVGLREGRTGSGR